MLLLRIVDDASTVSMLKQTHTHSTHKHIFGSGMCSILLNARNMNMKTEGRNLASRSGMCSMFMCVCGYGYLFNARKLSAMTSVSDRCVNIYKQIGVSTHQRSHELTAVAAIRIALHLKWLPKCTDSHQFLIRRRLLLSKATVAAVAVCECLSSRNCLRVHNYYFLYFD